MTSDFPAVPLEASQLKILVVDDYRDSADALTLLLSLLGDKVETAYDGRSALDIAARFHPDIVFLDLGLPDISGYEVAENLRKDESEKKMLLVAVSAWGREEDRRRSREAGFDVHLEKPYATDTILKALSRRKDQHGPWNAE